MCYAIHVGCKTPLQPKVGKPGQEGWREKGCTEGADEFAPGW